MKHPAAIKRVLKTYVAFSKRAPNEFLTTGDGFTQPDTNLPYFGNASISGAKLTNIKNPNTTIMFYEEKFDNTGKRAAAFADGHVLLVNRSTWATVAQAPS